MNLHTNQDIGKIAAKVGDPVHEDQGHRQDQEIETDLSDQDQHREIETDLSDQDQHQEIGTDLTNQGQDQAEVKTDPKDHGQDLKVNIDHNLTNPGPQIGLRCVGIVTNQGILSDFAGQEMINKEIPNNGVEAPETGDFKVLVTMLGVVEPHIMAPTAEIGRL